MGKIETDGVSMSRREFLRFSGLAIGGLTFDRWIRKAERVLGADSIGRVVELPNNLLGEAWYSLHGEGVDVAQANFFGVEYGGARTDFAVVAPYIDTQTGAVYPAERLFVSLGFNRQWSRYGEGNRKGKFIGQESNFDWRGLDSGIVQGGDRLPESQKMVWSLNEQPVLWYPLAREGWEKQVKALGSSGMFFLPPEKIAKQMGYDVAKGPVFLPVGQIGETGGGKKLLALASPELFPSEMDLLSDAELVARAPEVPGLSKVNEVVYGLERQRYVKYVDSEGLVRRVFDSETKEVLYAGESVWNAKEKVSGEMVRFGCLVVTSKGTGENDGHLEINKDKLEECARAVAAVAAINRGGNIIPAQNPSDSAKEALVQSKVDELLADIVADRKAGKTLKARLGNVGVDPTQVVVRLNYDSEATGMLMLADDGRRSNRLNYLENGERDLLQVILNNADFGDAITGFSHDVYFSRYPTHGWLYESLIRMLRNKNHSGLTGANDKYVSAPNSLYHAVFDFAGDPKKYYLVSKFDRMMTFISQGEDTSALSGDWFGGGFVKSDK